MSTEERVPRVLFAGGGTGGHLYPALAIAAAMQRRNPATQVMFAGARRGVEARVLPQREVPHILLPFEPIRRSRIWENWRLIPAMAQSMLGLNRTFRTFRPDLVVGSGGYASGPAVGWAIMHGIPTAVQEQNSYPGLTTRLVAGRTRQIHLAFPEARDHLKPGSRTQVFEFGNPIQPPDRSIARKDALAHFGLSEGPVALVVGGSQGARAINQALLRDLEGVAEGRLPPPPQGLQLLWATGPSHYDEVAERLLHLEAAPWVHAVGYIEQMPLALAAADLAVSRAGAMALAELCAWGVPGILVPLPTAAANHQFHNAVALADAGAAVLAPQPELSQGRLWSEISALASAPARRHEIAAQALARGRPDAADQIAAALFALLNR